MGYTRDLGSSELWQYSIDRSRRRRAAARHRRRIRRLSVPLAVAAAATAAPATAFAGSGGSASGRAHAHARVHYPRALRLGSTGPDVVALQRLLGVAPDGEFGPVTQAAVRRFQRAEGLEVDGVVGPLTRAALRRQDLGRAGQVSIVAGDRGPLVAWIQRRVGVVADGDFGPVTLAAVLRFQREAGLVVDGQVGPFTLAALRRVAPRAPASASRPPSHGEHTRHHHRRHRARPPVSSSFGARVVALARDELGVRYTWAGASPATGFDCSGLVVYVFGRLGVYLPHNAAEQYRYGTHVARAGLEPGDLVFFNDLGHVGIYIGDGEVIAAPHTGTVVSISPLAYTGTYVGATRIR